MIAPSSISSRSEIRRHLDASIEALIAPLMLYQWMLPYTSIKVVSIDLMIFSFTNFLLTILGLLTVALASHNHNEHQHPIKNTGSMSKSLNVFKQPLSLHSTSPMTGYLRNGYCEVPASDFGNHAIAAEVTEEFLDFTAKQGNDLRPIPGMKGGCKWCLCASRWLEAFEARKNEPAGDRIVPKVWLGATNEKALNKIKLEDLKGFAVDKE